MPYCESFRFDLLSVRFGVFLSYPPRVDGGDEKSGLGLGAIKHPSTRDDPNISYSFSCSEIFKRVNTSPLVPTKRCCTCSRVGPLSIAPAFSYPPWVDRDDDSLLSVDVGDLLDGAVALQLPVPLQQRLSFDSKVCTICTKTAKSGNRKHDTSSQCQCLRERDT